MCALFNLAMQHEAAVSSESACFESAVKFWWKLVFKSLSGHCQVQYSMVVDQR